jgi:hypothetical protein
MIFPDKYRNGQIEFIDYDNDNDLDIFMSGLVAPSYTFKSKLFENNNGVFTETSTEFGGDIINTQFAWGDLDNDGDLDLVLMGDFETFDNYSYIYRNDGNNNFVEFSNTISAFSQGKVKIADLDNDGDNDLVFGGLVNDPYGAQIDIYRNDGDFNFVYIDSIDGVMNGDMELRDSNDDGLIDILRTGFDGNSNSTSIYLNTNNLIFTLFTEGAFISSTYISNMVSADYNGNGELDILYAANDSYLYVNSGNMSYSFNALAIDNSNFTDVEVGDFDNDNDIDLFIAGIPSSRTHINQVAIANTQSLAPSVFSSTVINSDVTLNWNLGTDSETENTQLSYNLYVGTSSGSTDIVTPMSNLRTGNRKIVTIGNMQYKNEAVLSNLPNGTYYWAVQSIDNQYKGSTFSTEQTFTIDNLDVEEFGSKLLVQYTPNPVSDQLTISSNNFIEKMTISSALGEKLNTIMVGELTDFEIDFTSYDSGIYFVSLRSNQGEKIIKIIKR